MSCAELVAAHQAHLGARAALREATADVHLRMHGLAPFAAISAGRLSKTGYARLLRALFQFHSAVAVVAKRGGWTGVSSSAKRLELLAGDLDYLRMAPPPASAELALQGRQAALGAIYVAEGSMLGGKIIARQLDYLFGEKDGGRRFFVGQRQSDGIAWRRLICVIEGSLADPAALDGAVEGALAAFELCEDCLAQAATVTRPVLPGIARSGPSDPARRRSRAAASVLDI